MSILNYIKICEKNVGGNMYLFLTEASNVLDVTVTNGEVTEIFMVSANTFKQIQADQNGIIRQIKQLGSQGKEFYEHFVNFVCGKANKELNTLADSLSEASPCGIVAIVMDSNGQAWLVGWNETDDGDRPLYLNTDNFTSGKDLTEVEGGKRTFDLKTTSAFLDLPLDSTLNDEIKSEIMLGLGNAITLGFTAELGPEIIPDPNFANAGLWTPDRWVIAGNVASIAAGANSTCQITSPSDVNEVGETYRIEIIVDTDDLSSITVYVDSGGGNQNIPIAGPDTYIVDIVCLSVSEQHGFRGTGIAGSSVVSKYSIKKVL